MSKEKIKKINPKEPDKKNEKASDMLVGKWVKCNKCKEILYKEDLKNNYSICPNCGQYFRLSARRRIKQKYEIGKTYNSEDSWKESTLDEITTLKQNILTGFVVMQGHLCRYTRLPLSLYKAASVGI